jgi:hypothetical protein
MTIEMGRCPSGVPAAAWCRDQLDEALSALTVTLAPAQLADIERAVPPGTAAGGRYPEAQLAHMDSERH